MVVIVPIELRYYAVQSGVGIRRAMGRITLANRLFRPGLPGLFGSGSTSVERSGTAFVGCVMGTAFGFGLGFLALDFESWYCCLAAAMRAIRPCVS